MFTGYVPRALQKRSIHTMLITYRFIYFLVSNVYCVQVTRAAPPGCTFPRSITRYSKIKNQNKTINNTNYIINCLV